MSTIKLNIGGEPVKLEKSANHFVVKKRIGGLRGQLETAREKHQGFANLTFKEGRSTKDIEVYSIDSGCLNDAMDALRKEGPDVQWCGHVYHAEGDPAGLMIPRDTIYVELNPGADVEAFNKLLDKHKLEMVSFERYEPNTCLLRLTSDATENPLKIANALVKDKNVKLAEPDFAVELNLQIYRPADTLFSAQWHLENRGGFALTPGADVAAPKAWDISRGDPSIVVCVMDDGVDIRHNDFSSPNKIVAPRDFGQNDTDPSPVRNGRGSAGDNHGTSCAGVAVADENGIGTVGIAPRCRLMPVRTSGMIDNQNVEDLFDHARLNGADVISCSWGVAARFFTLSTRMKKAISRAATQGRNGKGCVIVFAAGNEDAPVNGEQNGLTFRSGFAIHPDVIAVAASNSHDVRSHYSNFGDEIWVCAPSSGSGGRGIITTDRSGFQGYQVGDYTTEDTFGGTSSSTPLVAGICGLILSVNPELTAVEVKEILKRSADKIDPAGGHYSAAGHSTFYGWGRVNAHSALVEASKTVASPPPTRTRIFQSAPATAIPDHNDVGIRDAIHVDDPADVTLVEISVSIRHTFVGDLVVDLIAPDGTRVNLHSREGGSKDDLIRSYTLETTPALSNLSGISGRGDWVLAIRDLAAIDLGSLESWTLKLGFAGSNRSQWEIAPGLPIPDNNPAGISSTLPVDGSGQVQALELTVDITHTYRADLRVTLEAPSGTTVPVHSFSGGSEDNIQRTYTMADTPTLQALAGESINGNWRLHVADHAAIDIGKLNYWKLKIN